VNLEPLWHIRLRTPRLELRLPNEEELYELYRVAAAGIHPPEEMPFAIAWTDELTDESFTDYHRGVWADWTPDRWLCNFVTFLAGRPIGTQGIGSEDFVQGRTVNTGSWLGQAFQRHGYGTEQRAAVLEFAFRGLGAERARTGALEGNVASMRVSQKLGYRRVGGDYKAPRGETVWHTDYELSREEWRCAIEVRIEGLEPALPLFGAKPSKPCP
jgi:RimJ/RimL family protein N-acetyltransferase